MAGGEWNVADDMLTPFSVNIFNTPQNNSQKSQIRSKRASGRVRTDPAGYLAFIEDLNAKPLHYEGLDIIQSISPLYPTFLTPHHLPWHT